MSIRSGCRTVFRTLAGSLLAVAIGGLAGCAAVPGVGPPAVRSGDFVPRQLLVGFLNGLSVAERVRLRDQMKASGIVPLFDDSELWGLPEGSDPSAAAQNLRQLAGIRYAQPNYIRRLDVRRSPGRLGVPSGAGLRAGQPSDPPALPGFSVLGLGLGYRIQAYTAGEFNAAVDAKENPLWHLAVIQASKAWDISPGSLKTFSSTDPPGKPLVVAVVDSGVDVRHPDLADNIAKDAGGQVRFFDEIKACGRSDVLVTPSGALNYDYETAYKDATHPGPDGNGHGTHVSGIIAAVGNNTPGVECKEPPCNTVGVGPGIAILPVKTMNALGDGDDFCIAKGLRDAADAGARVINLSVGGPQPGPALEEAIEYLTSKGALLVVASGNDGLRVNYPAAYPGAIAVGAVGHPGDAQYPDAIAKGAPYSSSGPDLALVEPGGSDTTACHEKKCGVYSTVPTYTSDISVIGKVVGTGYGRLTGTSMATPQVSAVAALILAREPGLTPRQVRQRLISTASPVGSSGGAFTDRFGYGMLNPFKALSQVSHDGT